MTLPLAKIKLKDVEMEGEAASEEYRGGAMMVLDITPALLEITVGGTVSATVEDYAGGDMTAEEVAIRRQRTKIQRPKARRRSKLKR